MKKCITILLSLLACSLSCHASSPLKYGIEWGASEQFYMIHNYSFETPNGSIYHNRTYSAQFATNTYVSASAGIMCGRHLMLEAHIGYSGLSERRAVVPLGIGQKWFFRSADADGLYLGLSQNVGITRSGFAENVYIGRATLGYRYRMSDLGCVDFLFNLRACIDHPAVEDPVFGKIPTEMIKYNSAGYFAASVGLAISF